MRTSHRIWICVALACAAFATYFFWPGPVAPGVGAAGGAAGAAQADATAAPGGAAAAAGAAGAGKSVLLGNPELQSPFGPGAPVSDVLAGGAGAAPAAGQPEKEVISAAEAARRQKMAALGYMVPPDYYSKDLKTLRMLAKGGDAYAMVHLGEKYYFELNGNKANPEYDSGTDYALAAKQSFKEALAAGNIRSAGIIAELYLQENNLAEAYAWHLVSERMGDSISADWFRSTKAAQQASDGLKKEAGARAAKITAELNGMKRKAA